MKVSIVGIGQVGASLAFGIVLKEMVTELVLIHHRPEIAEANAQDLQHTLLFSHKFINIRHGDIGESANSDVVVVTASRPWRDNFKSRLDSALDNTELFADLIPKIASVNPHAKLVIITNPVDVLTYHAIKLTGYEPNRVIGTGTLVDSARFRSLLAIETKIHPVDLRAYILGEHGNSQFPVFSSAGTGGVCIRTTEYRHKMAQKAATMGVDIYKTKGNTNFVVSAAAMYLIDSILHNSLHTMPVSVYLEDFHGVKDICLSVPAVIGQNGVNRIFKPKLNEIERKELQETANVVREVIDSTKEVYS